MVNLVLYLFGRGRHGEDFGNYRTGHRSNFGRIPGQLLEKIDSPSITV